MLAFSPLALAQEHIESLMQRGVNDENAAALLALVEEWDGRQIDVNTATPDELVQIPTMLEYEAQSIVGHIAKYGPLRSLSELYAIEAFTPARVRELLPFLQVGVPVSYPSWGTTTWSISQRASYSIPLAAARGSSGQPLGFPVALLTRVVAESAPTLRVGLKGIKATHEPFFAKHAEGGYPFYTGYVEASLARGVVRKVIVGDYTAWPGHGLTLGASSLILPGRHVLAWGKYAQPRAAFSLSDSHLLRGAALTLGGGADWHVEMGVSAKPTNATLRTDRGRTWLITLPSSGPFTTESSISRRRSMWEYAAYASSSYTHRHLTVGVTLAYIHLQYGMKSAGRAWFQRLVPQQLLRVGSHVAYYAPRVRIYGEGVAEFQFTPATTGPPITFLLGATRSIGSAWHVGVELYHYATTRHNHYQSVYAPTQGVYSGGHGAKGSVVGRIGGQQITLSGEVYAGRALRGAYAEKPQRYKVQVDYQHPLAEVWLASGMLRHAQRTYAVGTKSRKERHEAYHEGHIRIDYAPEHGWNTTTQLGGVLDAKGALAGLGHGWAVLQDVGYRLRQFTIRARLGYFRLAGAVRALYYYEHSPLYAFTIHRHSHDELRAYLYAKWQASRSLIFWVKAAHSVRVAGREPQAEALPIDVMAQVAYRFN